MLIDLIVVVTGVPVVPVAVESLSIQAWMVLLISFLTIATPRAALIGDIAMVTAAATSLDRYPFSLARTSTFLPLVTVTGPTMYASTLLLMVLYKPTPPPLKANPLRLVSKAMEAVTAVTLLTRARSTSAEIKTFPLVAVIVLAVLLLMYAWTLFSILLVTLDAATDIAPPGPTTPAIAAPTVCALVTWLSDLALISKFTPALAPVFSK